MPTIEEIAVFAKKKGFVFQNSEIYGGMAGFYDYGPLGVEMMRNIKNRWWKDVVRSRENVVGIDGSIISSSKVWEASGHLENFVDVLVECKKCNKKVRADHLVEEQLKIPTDGMSPDQLMTLIKKHKIKCNECGSEFGKISEFNLMFKTNIGSSGDEVGYMRAETAQIIFVNFKNVLETSRQKLPFGIAQIGKVFRNEIAPRNFLFRMREFEQMELEFFVHPKRKDDCEIFKDVEKLRTNVLTAETQAKESQDIIKITIGELVKKKIIKTKWQAYWIGYMYKWFIDMGINPEKLRLREHVKDELSHYSSSTWDIEYHYAFGWKELEGIADRSDFDLTQHTKFSKQDLSYFDPETKERVVPHVVAEPSVGVDRIFLTLLIDAYNEEEVKGEKRVVLKLNPDIAPFRVAVFPLVSKNGLDEKAREVFNALKGKCNTFFDESGSIGRRYRRQDEVGTPFCITIDYDTMKDESVTIRERDSMQQKRVKIKDLEKELL